MIKKPKNGLAIPHKGTCQALARLAVSSVGTEVSLSREMSWFGRPCSTCAEPNNDHKNQKTRSPDDNRNSLRSTPVLLIRASELNTRSF